MKTSFILIAASVVFNSQCSIFDEEYRDDKDGRNKAFRDTFEQIIQKRHIKARPRKSEYILLYKARLSKDMLYFQLAKEQSVETYQFIGNDFAENPISSYPPINIFVNLKCQQLAVEIKESIISAKDILPTMQNIFSNFIRIRNFSIFFNTIEDRKEFWQLIDKSSADEVSEIVFEMIVPNFFGVHSLAHDFVQGAKDDINADTVTLSFKNKKGALRAQIDYLGSYVDYSATSGSWKIKLKKDGTIKTLRSSDYSLRKQVESTVLEVIKSFDENKQIDSNKYQELLLQISNIFVKE